jgi:hypothetical protein
MVSEMLYGHQRLLQSPFQKGMIKSYGQDYTGLRTGLSSGSQEDKRTKSRLTKIAAGMELRTVGLSKLLIKYLFICQIKIKDIFGGLPIDDILDGNHMGDVC